jgi:hypothetical protein
VRQPLLFDVVPEADLAETPVVPGARENLLLLPVGGSQASGRDEYVPAERLWPSGSR